MHFIDYLIVIIPLSMVIGLAIYAKRYARSVVDFLAAGRVAGRYVISVGDMTAGLSVITLVALCEQNYQTGFGVTFWSHILTPIGILIALTGYCTYRWRETRCLSKGQFIELRYGSKSFRVVTAVISTISEMLTNAIGPAIAANFFIYYMRLPHKVMIFGIGLPCYLIVVVLCLSLALCVTWPAGRISLLITDCFQGLFSYPIFVMIAGFILIKFSWGQDISPVLWNRASGESFINPYDVSQLRDFNIFALIVTLLSSVLNRASWIGNDTTNSAKTPHEQKMAGILGAWRNGLGTMLMLLIAIVVIVFMNCKTFAPGSHSNPFKVNNHDIRQSLSVRVLEEAVPDKAKRQMVINAIHEIKPISNLDQHSALSQKNNLDTVYFDKVRQALGDTPAARYQYQKYRTLFGQMMMPTVMSQTLPVGLLGAFCLLMIMLLISTDDSRIFNATGCIVQDMILPYIKKRMTPKEHIRLIRLTALGVTLFFLAVALFFAQIDYITMFTTIMCALWLGGAGPIMIFGLYSRFGNLTGAWCSLIFGSGTSLIGLILQRNWARAVYPFLERNGLCASLDHFLVVISTPFEPWIHWELSSTKFPINSYEIFFLSMFLAISSYIIGSYLTYKPYNLDKLLHRGKYSDGHEALSKPWTLHSCVPKLLGITSDYTKGDKILTWLMFSYSFIYGFLFAFLGAIIWNFFSPWSKLWWDHYFYLIYILVPTFVGIITTVWFLIGGYRDLRRLFKDLDEKKDDSTDDNGQVFSNQESRNNVG
ncbi:MAG: sodium:panthothenate symporter [Lentisphaeria bacterium]